MTPTTGERLAVLETKLEHVDQRLDQLGDRVQRIEAKFDAMDGKLDQVLLKLAEQPKGWSLSAAAKQSIGGIVGAVLIYLATALGLPLPHISPPQAAPSEQPAP